MCRLVPPQANPEVTLQVSRCMLRLQAVAHDGTGPRAWTRVSYDTPTPVSFVYPTHATVYTDEVASWTFSLHFTGQGGGIRQLLSPQSSIALVPIGSRLEQVPDHWCTLYELNSSAVTVPATHLSLTPTEGSRVAFLWPHKHRPTASGLYEWRLIQGTDYNSAIACSGPVHVRARCLAQLSVQNASGNGATEDETLSKAGPADLIHVPAFAAPLQGVYTDKLSALSELSATGALPPSGDASDTLAVAFTPSAARSYCLIDGIPGRPTVVLPPGPSDAVEARPGVSRALYTLPGLLQPELVEATGLGLERVQLRATLTEEAVRCWSLQEARSLAAGATVEQGVQWFGALTKADGTHCDMLVFIVVLQ